jgi:hypothetical protein
MKSFLPFLAAAALLLGTGSTTFAKARGKVALSDFDGNYKGTLTYSVGGGVFVLQGPVSLSFKTLKSGKSATVTVRGSLSQSGMTLPVSAKISLNNGNFQIDNFVFNTIAQGSYPGFGTYTRLKRAIAFAGSAPIGQVIPFSGSFQTSTKGRRQSIVFTDTVETPAFVVTFTFNVSRHEKAVKP